MKALPKPSETRVEIAEALASGLGMAGPVLAGAATGHLSLGFAAAVGGLAASGVSANSSAKAHAQDLASAFAPAAVAAIAAAMIAGHGALADALVILLAGGAAVVGGYSLRLAVATTRFILFLIVLVHVFEATPNRGELLAALTAAALWTGALRLIFCAVARASLRTDHSTREAGRSPPTAAQRLARWKKSLTRLAGWQFALRLVPCLAIAAGARYLWPGHHLHWIAIAVAILCQRQPEASPRKTTQRVLGTVIGALAMSIFLASEPPAWALIVAIGLLATARPSLKARDYLAYTAIMTPLIILIVDGGALPGFGILADRVIATLIGAGLVVAANRIVGRLIARTS